MRMKIKIDIPEAWTLTYTSELNAQFIGDTLSAFDDDLLRSLSVTQSEARAKIDATANLATNSNLILTAVYVYEDHESTSDDENEITFMCYLALSWLPLDEMPEGINEPSALAIATLILGGSGSEFGENAIIGSDQILFDPSFIELSDCSSIRLQWSEAFPTVSTDSLNPPDVFKVNDTYIVEPPFDSPGLVLLQFSCPTPWAMEAFFEISRAIAQTLKLDVEEDLESRD